MEAFTSYWIKWVCAGIASLLLIFFKQICKKCKDVYEYFKAKNKKAYLQEIDNKIEQLRTDMNKKIEDYHSEVEEFKEMSLGADEEQDGKMERILAAIDELREGVLSSHYNMLLKKAMLYVEQGWISVEALDNFEEEYEVYKHLHGNGHMEKWVKKVRALPNKNKGE